MTVAKGRVLIIAGSDSGGGAGIQADIKTVTALGGYAMTAVTAITVQNTLGVTGVHPVPPAIIRGQIDAVMDDLGADAWKIGMLGSAEIVRLVEQAARERARYAPIVLDPVMIAKGGAPLLASDAIEAVRAMLPIVSLVTPNAPEAAALVGFEVRNVDEQMEAAEALLKLGARAVLVKGGHIDGPILRDVLMSAESAHVFEVERIATRATHGTGCTLASAIATGLAQGFALQDAVARARRYLIEAIKAAPGYGNGWGPLGHGWTVNKVD